MGLFANETPHERALSDLKADLRTVLDHAEDLVHAAATQSGEKLDSARAKAEIALADARRRLAAAEARAAGAAREAAEAARLAGERAQSTIKAHPWAAVGIGAGVGLLLGMLISRR